MVRKFLVVVLLAGVAGGTLGRTWGQNAQNGPGNGANGQNNQWQGNPQAQQRLQALQDRLAQRGIDMQQLQQNFQQRLQQQGIDPQQLQQQLMDRLQQAGVDTQQLQQQLQQAGLGQGLLGGNVGIGFVDPTAEMERVLTDLTDDQKAQLKDKAAAALAATNDFRTRENTKMQELSQTGDQQAMQAQREMTRNDAVALQFKNEEDIESALTAEQRNTWKSYLLGKLIKQKLQAAELTQEQADKVDAIVKEAGKELTAATDSAAKNKLEGVVYRRVLDDVVSDDQFGLMVGMPR